MPYDQCSVSINPKLKETMYKASMQTAELIGERYGDVISALRQPEMSWDYLWCTFQTRSLEFADELVCELVKRDILLIDGMCCKRA